MKRIFSVMVVVSLFFAMFILAGCSDKAEKAEARAQQEKMVNNAVFNATAQFAELRVVRDGQKAERLVKGMKDYLAAVNLPLNYISLKENDAKIYIRRAYVREAQDSYQALRKCIEPTQAEKYRDNIKASAAAANHSLRSIGINEVAMNSMVAQTHIRAASRLTGEKYAKVDKSKEKPVQRNGKKVKM